MEETWLSNEKAFADTGRRISEVADEAQFSLYK
jgi:hypothetical protein